MLVTPFFLGLLPVSALAASPDATWVSGLESTLSNLGLTKIVSVIQNVSQAVDVVSTLIDVGEVAATLLCPEDAAFTVVAPAVLDSAEELAALLTEHFLKGSHPASSIASSPKHSVTHSFLDDPDFVQLGSDIGQAVILTIENGVGQILNQGKTVTIKNTTTYENLIIHVIDSVLDIPPSFGTLAQQLNLTALVQFVTQIGLNVEQAFSAPALTIFAPIDTAFTAATTDIGSATPAALQALLGNHYVNGTVVYSDQFTTSYTSASGEQFTLSTNTTGSFVTSGSTTATVITLDIPFENGVIHLIDQVLFNTNSNPAAASSALAANQAIATSQAVAQSSSLFATVTVTETAGGSTSSSGLGSSKSAAALLEPSYGNLFAQAVFSMVGMFAGVAFL